MTKSSPTPTSTSLQVIKLGGHESEDPLFLKAFASALGSDPTVVVHGGGKEITRLEKQILNREALYVDGLRYTDTQTLNLVEMVLSGSVNPRIVRALSMQGRRAIGLSGSSSGIVTAQKLADLGEVGRVTHIHADLLRHFVSLGITPVLAPLATSQDHRCLNTNADTVASAVAVELNAARLVLLTNVEGILIDGVLREEIPLIELDELLESGQITGGMLPKIQAAQAALQGGVKEVLICNIYGYLSGRGTRLTWKPELSVQLVQERTQSLPKNSAETPLLQTYQSFPVQFSSGSGVELFDEQGNRYLDFGSGIAVSALGHQHPRLRQALERALDGPWHVSNLFENKAAQTLAQILVENSFSSKVFFSNSGAEANEAAIKFARKYHKSLGSPRRQLVRFSGAFHGRTMGSLSLTSNANYRAPFEPLLSDVIELPFNDVSKLDSGITAETAAVFLEPIQGEAGVRLASQDFLLQLKKRCKETGTLLVFDEVQCGFFRSGKLWAHGDILPDIMTLAKSLGGGLPLGATLVSQDVALSIESGDHGSTFGGNPISCALGAEVLHEILSASFQENLKNSAEKMGEALSAFQRQHSDLFPELRGAGLMWGLDTIFSARDFQKVCLSNGLILLTSGPNTLRFLPPLIVSSNDIDNCISLLDRSLTEFVTQENTSAHRPPDRVFPATQHLSEVRTT